FELGDLGKRYPVRRLLREYDRPACRRHVRRRSFDDLEIDELVTFTLLAPVVDGEESNESEAEDAELHEERRGEESSHPGEPFAGKTGQEPPELKPEKEDGEHHDDQNPHHCLTHPRISRFHGGKETRSGLRGECEMF